MSHNAPPVACMSFHRNPRLKGVEVRSVRDSAEAWCCYSSDYEFLAPQSWHGSVKHRRKTLLLEPGQLLCMQPGDVFSARPALIPGSGSALTIEPSVLAEYVEEHPARLAGRRLVPHAPLSLELGARLGDVFRAFHTQCSALEVQTSLVEFFALAMPELLGLKVDVLAERHSDARAATRLRECLEDDHGEAVDLDTLAGEVGLSRFRALRLFKRHFELPPHAYHLRMRLGLAQRALRSGQRPAEVAAECGFTDQSHMTRHFKRIFGVTPAEYARIGRSAALVAPAP
jgi:AraC-like DNA-binding protein